MNIAQVRIPLKWLEYVELDIVTEEFKESLEQSRKWLAKGDCK